MIPRLIDYILNSAWQVPLIALAVWLLARITRPSPRIHHVLWILALIAAVLLPAARTAPEPAPITLTPEMLAALAAAPPVAPSRLAWLHPHSIHLGAPATTILLAIYLTALAAYLFTLYRSCRAAGRILRNARPAELPETVTELIERCSAQLNLEPPRVLASSEVWSPMVLSVRNPALILPHELALTATPQELEAICWHELYHIRRRDLLANLACRLSLAPVAYHPAAHAIASRVRQTREIICDAAAAERMRSNLGYARCLVEMARRTDFSSGIPNAGPALFDHGVLEERVMQLIQSKPNVSPRTRVLRASAGIAAVFAVLATAAAFHVTPTLAQSAPQPAVEATPAEATTPAVAPVAAADPVPAAQATPAAEPQAAPEPPAPPAPVAAPAPAPAPEPNAEQREAEAKSAADAERHAKDDERRAKDDERRAQEAERRAKDSEMHVQESERHAKDAERHNQEAERRAQDAERHAKDNAARDSERIQKQVDEALRHVNSPEFQEKIKAAVDQANKSVNSPEFKERLQREIQESVAQANKVNSPEFKRHLQEQMDKVNSTVNSPEFKKRLQDEIDRANKLNTPEFQKQIQDQIDRAMRERSEAMEQMKRQLAATINSPQFREQMEKLNSPEFKEHMKQLDKQMKDMNKDLEDKVKEIDKAHPAAVPSAPSQQ